MDVFIIEKIEMNVQREASGFFHGWGEKWTEPLPEKTARARLQTRLFCIAISYP